MYLFMWNTTTRWHTDVKFSVSPTFIELHSNNGIKNKTTKIGVSFVTSDKYKITPNQGICHNKQVLK